MVVVPSEENPLNFESMILRDDMEKKVLWRCRISITHRSFVNTETRNSIPWNW